MNTKKHILKWLILVGLNTIVSVYLIFDFSSKKAAWDANIAILLGVVSFVFIYATIDKLLYRKNIQLWRRSLQHGVTISALFYLIIPAIPMLTGMLSTEIFSMIRSGASYSLFFSIYSIVIIDGFILSLIAIIPILVVYLILQYRHSVDIKTNQ